MEEIIKYFLFQPPKPTPIPRRFIYLETKFNCLIPVCYISAPGAKKTLLYSHGNAEDLSRICNYLEDMSRILDVNILCYDYSGYGLSKAGENFDEKEASFHPSEERCYADIEAVYEFITKGTKKFAPKDIILYGRSLGSGPTCYLAQKLSKEGVKIGGVILHSPFMSVFRIVLNFTIGCGGDMFSNIDRIPEINCPIFIIHGKIDRVVPFSHGNAIQEQVRKSLKTTPFWAEGMGHNDIEVRMAGEFLQRLHDFIDYVELREHYNMKKSLLLKKQAEINLLKKILYKKVELEENKQNLAMLEDRHENEYSDTYDKAQVGEISPRTTINTPSVGVNDSIMNPKKITRSVSISIQPEKIEVLKENPSISSRGEDEKKKDTHDRCFTQFSFSQEEDSCITPLNSRVCLV